jgi:hypothetical protein
MPRKKYEKVGVQDYLKKWVSRIIQNYLQDYRLKSKHIDPQPVHVCRSNPVGSQASPGRVVGSPKINKFTAHRTALFVIENNPQSLLSSSLRNRQ